MLLRVPYLRPLQHYSALQQSSFEHLQHISRQLQSDLDCLAQVAATYLRTRVGGSVAEWLACWTQVQRGPWFKSQPRRCQVTLLGKLFTPILPLFTKQQNW